MGGGCHLQTIFFFCRWKNTGKKQRTQEKPREFCLAWSVATLVMLRKCFIINVPVVT